MTCVRRSGRSRGDMTKRILIGMLVASSLLGSRAAEPEERAPTPATENATTSVEELVGRSGSEVDAPSGDDEAVLEPLTPAPSIATTPSLQASSQPTSATAAPPESDEETPVADSGDVVVGEPPATDPDAAELPEPRGPWVDPRQPDFTKTVPPPRR